MKYGLNPVGTVNLALSGFLLGGWKRGLRRHLLRQLLHGLGPITGASPKPRSSLKLLHNRAQGTGSRFRKGWEKGTDRGKTEGETFPRATPIPGGLRSFILFRPRREKTARLASPGGGLRPRAPRPGRDRADSCGPTPAPREPPSPSRPPRPSGLPHCPPPTRDC